MTILRKAFSSAFCFVLEHRCPNQKESRSGAERPRCIASRNPPALIPSVTVIVQILERRAAGASARNKELLNYALLCEENLSALSHKTGQNPYRSGAGR
jgi:hypothetical protein